MNRFLTLLSKEITELMRNGKLIWLPVVLMIIGISQPLTSYYMPQILDMAGNLPEGASITIPTPSGEEVLSGALSQYGTIGTLSLRSRNHECHRSGTTKRFHYACHGETR